MDAEYARFVDFLRYNQPTKEQVEDFQDVVLYTAGELLDDQIYAAYNRSQETSIMTVSCAAAQHINEIVVSREFLNQPALSTVPCTAVSNGQHILPYRGMRVVITENRDKTSRIINGQDAVLVSAHNNCLLIQFPDNERPFVYPVTHRVEGEGDVTTYPLTPAYARTICKSQGQNLKHLLVWLDCPTVPPGLAYVALSRVRRKFDLSLLQPMQATQLMPVTVESLNLR